MNKYWIWLLSIPYIGSIMANLLLERFDKPENIYNAHIQEVCDSGGVSKKQAERIVRHHLLDKADDIIEQCYAKDIKILTIHDALYPPRAIMHDAPVVLYYKGRLRNLGQTVGIVGARRCTQEARHKAIEKAEKYTLNNISVISGMAKGIDAYAHTSCIKAGGYTIAMLVNGLDICYPKEQDVLMQSIIENGVVILEYSPGVKSDQYRFPRRIRLISSWSDKLVVIGAGHRRVYFW